MATMIDFNNFEAGQSRGKNDTNAFYDLTNCDIHSEIGQVRPQYALTPDTATGAPNEPCVQAITNSGTIYYFSTSSGKVWKRSTAGTYTSITANTNSGHRGARYYNGHVYFWTATKLGRFVSETEASRNNSFGTFSNGIAYGSCEENLQLFITDGKYLASVNSSGTFNPNALDIPAQYVGTAVTPDGMGNIILGTIVDGTVHDSLTFVWDTYSDSFLIADIILERGVNCFINCDDVILAQCGTEGHLYYWDGSGFAIFDKDLRVSTENIVGPQASVVFNGKPLIAVGTKIYSIYRRFTNVPRALVHEYTASAAITTLEASKDFLSVSTSTGIEKIGASRATATVTTPRVAGATNDVQVHYISGGDNIDISVSIDDGSFTDVDAINDDIRNIVYFDGGLVDHTILQAKVTFSDDAIISNVGVL